MKPFADRSFAFPLVLAASWWGACEAPAEPPPAVAWYRSLSTGSLGAALRACVATPQGAVMVFGETFPISKGDRVSFGGNALFVALVSRRGEVLFARNPWAERDLLLKRIQSAILVGGEDVVAIGYTIDLASSEPSAIKALAFRVNSQGTTVWRREVGGDDPTQLSDVCQLDRESLLAVGSQAPYPPSRPLLSDAYLCFLGGDGSVLREEKIERDGQQYLNAVATGASGTVVCAGSTTGLQEHASSQAWILKLDLRSGIQWERAFRGFGSTSFSEVAILGDGSMVAVGQTSWRDGLDWKTAGYMAKLDAEGDIHWERTLPAGEGEMQFFNGLALPAGQGFVVTGRRLNLKTDGDSGDVIAWRFDTDGSPLWEKRVARSTRTFTSSAVTASWDGGFYVASDCAEKADRACLLRLAPDRLSGRRFLRGDCNDRGSVELGDAISVLGFLFQGSPEPGCLDACDANDDGELGLTDAVLLLSFLFGGGPELPPPADFAGVDLSLDALGCEGR